MEFATQILVHSPWIQLVEQSSNVLLKSIYIRKAPVDTAFYHLLHVMARVLEGLLAPVLVRLGIPPETAAMLFIRPVSGSGALAIGSELMAAHGPDSYVGRVAAVMLGSTETTFYTVAVYFGAAGIRKTRYAIPAALIADLTGFMTAALAVRLFFGAA